MQLSSSLLSGLIPSLAGKPGSNATSRSETGKAGGDFSSLLNLLAPATGGTTAKSSDIGDNALAPKGEPDAALPVDVAALATGSAMPPVAASGKILPASLPDGLPPLGLADEAVEADGAAPPTTGKATLAMIKITLAPPVAIPEPDPIETEAATLPLTASSPEGVETEEGASAPAAPADGPVPVADQPQTPPVKIEAIIDIAPAPVIAAAEEGAILNIAPVPPLADSEEADLQEAALEAGAKKVAIIPAAVLPLPIAGAATITATISDDVAEGEAAPAPSAVTLPAAAIRQALVKGEALQDGQQAAITANAKDAAPSDNRESPALTLRIAEREQALATRSETRPANGERAATAEPVSPAARFAALAQGEITRPKPAASSINTNPSALAVTPIASAPADAAPVAPVLRAPSHEPMADLAQIVDRLAAAREAVAPARAALSIDHAEFGELTLRFDQRHDGRLTAELAGANAEAHRAVSHALAADRSQTGGSDSNASQQQHSSGQTARASAGDKDASTGNGAAQDQRQDTARQRGGRSAQQARSQGGGNQPQSGVFA